MYSQQPLPANPDRVEGYFLQGLPWQIPYRPNLGLPPQMDEIVSLTMGVAIQELQERATVNHLRTFLFNWMSQNNYNNPQFIDLLSTAVEYVEFILASDAASGRRSDVQATITLAVKEVCAIFSSIATQQFPPLARYVTGERMAQDIQRWISHFNQLSWQIKNFQQQQQQMAYQQPVASAPSYYQQPQAAPSQYAMPGQYQQVPGQQYLPYQSGQGSGAGTESTGLTAARARRRRRQQHEEVNRQPLPVPARQAPQWDGEDEWLAAPVSSAQHEPWEEVAPSQDVREELPVETPKAKKIDYDNFVRGDGSHWRPAHKSGWERTRTLTEQPYSPAYDPTKYILYHRRSPDGEIVTEALMEINDDNQYLAYELDPTFARKTRLSRQGGADAKAKVDWSEVGKTKTMDEIAESRQRRLEAMQELAPDATEEDLPELPEPERALPVFTASSLEEAGLGASMIYLYTYGEEPSRDVPLEYSFRLCKPFFCEGNLKEALNELAGCKTFAAAKAKMEALYTELPERVWYYLNDNLTAHVNQALRINLGLEKLSIVSFTDDILDLINSMHEFGEDAEAKALTTRAGEIIAANTQTLKGKDLTGYLKGINYPAKDVSVIDRLLVLCSTQSVTEVPWLSSDVDIELANGRAGAILESQFPTLYQAVKRIFERNKKINGGLLRHSYILTRDNVLLRVHEGFIGKDFYLIEKA